MSSLRPLVVLILLACAAPAFADERRAETAGRNWPAWRGPLATGEAPLADPPIEWDSDGTNIRWKAAIPGRGHSTPIVWGNRIFLTTAVPVGEALPPRPSTAPGNHDNLPVTHRQKFVALALNRIDGKIVWQKSLREALPVEQGHRTGSLASSSPVTDGEHLIVSFGSFGVYCLDFDGNLIWKKDFGRMDTLHGHGEGASPVLHGNTVVVNWDHEGESFVAALDKRTGKLIWRADRDEVTSWATPIVVTQTRRASEGTTVTRSVSEEATSTRSVSEDAQLIVPGTARIRGYDLTTGKVLWECGGLSSNIVASPVHADGMLFAGSSYDKRALLAIRLEGAAGDITGTDHVVWSRFRGTPYVPSPLLVDGGLYFLTHYQPIITRLDAPTGEDKPGAIRLEGLGNIYASPVSAGGRVYITDLDGTTLVMTTGEIPRALALNPLGEAVSASAALAGNELFLRGEKHLYCIAGD
ncbi:MAG TPA: PQQ-binding-like beta-propeller repeat protein [Pirellulaceae bacterium]|nr:PQQ-binding-like beta-propeller repeat protein [Pirellulaceae bacterium]